MPVDKCLSLPKRKGYKSEMLFVVTTEFDQNTCGSSMLSLGRSWTSLLWLFSNSREPANIIIAPINKEWNQTSLF